MKNYTYFLLYLMPFNRILTVNFLWNNSVDVESLIPSPAYRETSITICTLKMSKLRG